MSAILHAEKQIIERGEVERIHYKRKQTKGFQVSPVIYLSAISLITAMVLILFPDAFDRPFTAFFNVGAIHNPFLDVIFYNLALRYTSSGIFFLACLCYCWFSSSSEMKARILSGTLVSIVAGMFSRLLQHALPSHPRPLHDPQIAFQLPLGIDRNDFNHWDSFPSDHAAVWFGLALVIFIARPRLGILAMIWAAITLFARNYLGFHYPTDLIGGAALGSLCVGLIQLGIFQRFTRPVVDWSERHAPLFYGLAFFISYQIATLCDDIRQTARGIAAIFQAPSV